jgi:hypothetical protein
MEDPAMRRLLRVKTGVHLFALALAACAGSGGGEPEEERRDFEVVVHESSAERFRATVWFGMPKFTTVEQAGETFTEVELAECRPGGAMDGEPGVPIFTRLLAVPQGARALVTDVKASVAETRSLLLHPYQAQAGDFSPAFEQDGPIPLEETGWVPPFAYDMAAYARTAVFPPDPVKTGPLSDARDLSMAMIQVAAGRYAPASQELTLYSRVEFTVEFVGGTGRFLREGAGNPFEEGSKTALAATWNAAAVESFKTFDPVFHIWQGEELLVLTTPEYRSAADRLAAHKNGRGLLTSVVEVNDGPGGGPDTKEEIKAFLDARYANAVIRFSYLLLLGDDGDIAPYVLPRRYKEGDFPSDFPYAQIATDPMDDDLVPEIAVGRIAVGTLEQADVVVDKIIQYESNPPTILPGGTFYGRAAIASYFQPAENGSPPSVENKRRFIQDSEEVRGHFANHGFETQRIYVATLPLTAQNTPEFYRDGTTPLPPPLRPQDGFPWDGDTAQIVDAFNLGKSLFFHVDHGGRSGWGHPHFTTSHLGQLTNGELLPLVLSDNCSSGAFDGPTAGFSESILRMSGGGAIGVIAFTRNSNNGVGRQFLIGVVDSLWPSAYPTFGDAQERHRLGDMLNHARARMTVNVASADPSSQDYLVAWAYARMITLFGDPTLKVWVENPKKLPLFGEHFVDGPAIEIGYPFGGATITVFERQADQLVAIGRGTTNADGHARIDAMAEVKDPGALRFFASAPGAVEAEIDLSGP